MTRGSFWALGLALGLLLAAQGSAAAPGQSPTVVLELFTSQGCSSCPAADRVLSRLGSEARSDGILLVPLSFHVDYWNRLGWPDPFSSPRWSARQRRYGELFGLRSVYTPQIVVNGSAELVGSHEGRLRASIREQATPGGAARIEIVEARLEAPGELLVELAAELDQEAPAGRLVANLALFESGLVTRVERGENAQRTLENDYVVRLLRPAIVFEAGPSERRELLRISLDPIWSAERLGVAAFVQDRMTLEIHAAAVLEQLVPRRSEARPDVSDRRLRSRPAGGRDGAPPAGR